VVNGAGPMSAPVWIIGQNGGRREEELNEPMVGWTGNKVVYLAHVAGLVALPNDEALKSMSKEDRAGVYDWARAQLRRDNVVKCRPPRKVGGDQEPTDDEIENCRHYLMDDLRNPPQMVVTLGAPAMKWFSNKHRISECHGTVEHWTHPDTNDSITYMPMYHPAMSHPSRRPWMAPVIIEDWRWLGVVLRGDNDQEKFAQHRAVLDKLIY